MGHGVFISLYSVAWPMGHGKKVAEGALAAPRVPDEGAQVSLGGEGFDTLDTRVVDAKLNGLNADFVESE